MVPPDSARHSRWLSTLDAPHALVFPLAAAFDPLRTGRDLTDGVTTIVNSPEQRGIVPLAHNIRGNA